MSFQRGDRVEINFPLPEEWTQTGTVSHRSVMMPRIWYVDLDGKTDWPQWFRESEMIKL